MVQRVVSKSTARAVIWLVLYMLAVIAIAGSTAFAADTTRTVIDNPRGGCYIFPYGWPNNPQWSEFGAYYGLPGMPFDQMPGNALKGVQGRLHYHGMESPSDGTNPDFYLFPSAKAHAFEADEISKGRQPFWWTATYQGQSRPVMNSLIWNPFGVKGQALNLSDDRFIKFFINEYERGIEMQTGVSQWVCGIDGCFDWIYQQVPYYGVFDNNGTFGHLSDIGVTHLDQPFPQNDTECLDRAAYCFSKLNEWAPDVRLICNGPSLRDQISDWSTYDNIFGNIYGILMEDFCNGSRSWKESFYCYYFYNLNFLRNLRPSMINKVQMFHVRRGDIPENLRDAYCAHLICSGPNRFFGPMDANDTEIAPASYADMKNALGEPIRASKAMSLDSIGHQWLLSRETQGGWVYFNNSVQSRRVILPGRTTWYDRNGERIIYLILSPGAGDYVKNIRGQRCATVMINPRQPETITGPVTVTLSTAPWTTGTTIRYTTDGRNPDPTSRVYTGPFTVNSSCTVKAYATKPGLRGGFLSSARYDITNIIPVMGFHLTTDGMSQFLDYYPLVKLDRPSSSPITVQYAVTGGTAIRGTHYDLYNATNTAVLPSGQVGALTIPAGDRYAHFHIKMKNGTVTGGNKTINIALSSPTNATLGADSTFTYTIQE